MKRFGWMFLLVAAFLFAAQPLSLARGAHGAQHKESSEGEKGTEGKDKGGGYEYEDKDDETFGSLEDESYKGLHYVFGAAGSYFVNKVFDEMDGTSGAYMALEYRFSKFASVGIESNYGWLAGGGGDVYASFINPYVRIFPLGRKSSSFEPFVLLGGKLFDGMLGASSNYYDSAIGYAQGGFAGLGARIGTGSGDIGFDIFVRAEFLYMSRPKYINEVELGGKGFGVPLFFGAGITL